MKLNFPFAIAAICGLSACETATPTSAPSVSNNSTVHSTCETAVASQANVPVSETIATTTEPTDVGTLTTVILKGAEAPWNCRANIDGVITSVEYSQEG